MDYIRTNDESISYEETPTRIRIRGWIGSNGGGVTPRQTRILRLRGEGDGFRV